jgi:type IV pilus assembly protein PilM
MFSFLKNFTRPGKFLGCDIGTTSIKMVELARKGNATQLKNYALLETLGHFERSNNVIHANALKISERETIQLLKTLLAKTKFSTNAVVASIPSFASFVTLLELPDMPPEETKKTMLYQVEQHIPLPLSEVAVDWAIVGQREDESGFTKQQILMIAIPNETIAKYRAIFTGAGLSLKALEVEILASTRAVVGSDQTPSVLLDIGARSTNVTVVDQGFVKSNMQIDYAGDSLTVAVAKGLGIDSKRAEELKKQRGLLGGRGEYELSTLEIPFLDVILQEANQARAQYEHDFGKKIERVLLIGGGANLLGIEKYAEQLLGVPVVLGNGLLYVGAPADLQVVAKELETRFAIAVGCAVKGLL